MVCLIVGLILAKYRVVEPPSEAQDPTALGWERINANSETILKHFVGVNMVNSRDPKRRWKNLIIAEDLKRGKVHPWQAQHVNLWEELSKICEYSEMGMVIFADVKAKKWVFDVIVGSDRTKEQSVLSPVLFSFGNQNINNYCFEIDSAEYRTTGYALGKGEDEKRSKQRINPDNTEFDRIEEVLDLSSSEDIDELIYYANQKMGELKLATSIKESVLPKGFIYGKDYFLGDEVSVYIGRLDLLRKTKITGVKEIWEASVGYKIELVFGDKLPDLFSYFTKIKQKG